MPYTADDFGVPPARIPEMMEKIKKIVEGKSVINITAAHIGDGNLHGGIAIDLNNELQVKEAKEMAEAIFNAALELEGTIACEHGIGSAKIGWLKKEKKDSYPVMKLIKKALDPDNIMNPGKMFEQGDLC
jgi:FAD/FMN-containing dehydrogenase